MSDIFRKGWHPKGKEGGKESWRGDFKGINQVAGWVGKGKGAGGDNAESSHIARPLASLKDPASFGAPPRNVNYHGGAALPNEITPHRGGLGAPLTQEQIESARNSTTSPTHQEAEKSQKPGPPPLPYRADRTGLRTDNLPPPPKHQALGESSPVTTPTASKPTPHLPPRLPARQNTATPPPPPSYETATNGTSNQSSTSFLNQSAINRLGNAGVSVPALGIGKNNNTTTTNNDNKTSDTTDHTPSSGLSGLQNRFAQMNMGTNKTSSPAATPSQTGSETQSQPQPQPQTPTWQQTRQALTTANSAYKDPSSVSLSDAQNAAQTAQNAQRSAAAFRERNQETINAAQTRATQINKKYNMTGRLNKWLEDANAAHDKQEKDAAAKEATEPQTTQGQQPGQQPAQPPVAQQQPQINSWQTPQSQGQQQQPVSSPPPQSSTPELTASISRKPPPPPPPKKPASMQAPPPVPLGTKPSFG